MSWRSVRFEKMKKDADWLETDWKRYEKLIQGDSAPLRAEAYRQLRVS